MTFTTEEHWRHYADFCRYEQKFGGPSSQLSTVVEMCRGCSEEERLWRTFCYIAVYNVPYGEVIWRHDPTPEWLSEAFARGHITTRVERRCLRRADWMQEYFAGVRALMKEWLVFKTLSYEAAWNRVLQMPRVGRYIAIRTLELLRRQGIYAGAMPDIRPHDAKTSRDTLGLLVPGWGVEARDNSPALLETVKSVTVDAMSRLSEQYGVTLDFYQFQVTLCEYRQSWKNKKQYPGRSLDSELKYARRAEREWEYVSDIWRARRALFPEECLGELNGWEGTRREAGCVLSDHGYTWSDLLYDYNATSDFSQPVRRQ